MKFNILTEEGPISIPIIEKFTHKGRVLVFHRAFRRNELAVILHSVSDFKTGLEIANGTKENVYFKAIDAIDNRFDNELAFNNYFINEFIDETVNLENHDTTEL